MTLTVISFVWKIMSDPISWVYIFIFFQVFFTCLYYFVIKDKSIKFKNTLKIWYVYRKILEYSVFKKMQKYEELVI